MQFSCTQLSVSFGSAAPRVTALRDLCMECRSGEFLSLIGPSGCGKTTLLRVLAGMLRPSAGTVEFPHRNGSRRTKRLMVYQEDSLFPWMTVLENAAFGMEMAGVPRKERENAARQLLARYRLDLRGKSYPHEISAGMKQRVAVVRAFLSEPALLLMDEPFGALDSPTRFALQSDLLDIWRGTGLSVVFVTHDVDEAVYLSDRVLVMSHGPGRVTAEVAIDLPRENRRDAVLSERFVALKREVIDHLARADQREAPREEIHAA